MIKTQSKLVENSTHDAGFVALYSLANRPILRCQYRFDEPDGSQGTPEAL
jgi:hypothetical protein